MFIRLIDLLCDIIHISIFIKLIIELKKILEKD